MTDTMASQNIELSSWNIQYVWVGWPGSSVVITTDYGLDSSGSNPGRDEIFRPSSPTLGPNQPLVK